jgi:hypothetical protein
MLTAWLVFQLVGVAAPLLAATGSALEEACTCPGGVHATTCPMHHVSGGSPKSGHANEAASTDATHRCALTSAYAPTDLALLALAGGAGVLPRVLTSKTVDPASLHVAVHLHLPSSRSELPDSPPPRA